MTIAAARPDLVVPETAVARRRGARWWRVSLAVGVPLVVGLIHVAVVAPLYHVGSFDDDASYLLTAQALLHGAGMTGHLTSGALVVGAYPPGYSFLLVPLLWLWPHSFAPERILSVVSFTALFPLVWMYLGRRRIADPWRVAVLAVLALNPVLATFGSMVMAETTFLVLFVVWLLILERWDGASRVLGPRGIGIVVAGAGLVWLKEAGIGLVLGLGLWLVLRRHWARAVAVVGGCAVLLLPVVVLRLVGGVALAGSRYSQELGGYYSGGLVARLVHVAPTALAQYFSTALPASIVPSGSPLPQTGPWAGVLSVLAWQVGLFTVVGLGVAVVRHRDLTVVAVPVYVAETLLWPYVNERRVILVLPIVVTWYVLGLAASGEWFLARLRARQRRWAVPYGGQAFLAVAGVAVVLYPLVVQFPRDYLFAMHQTSSQPAHSRYMAILAAAGRPSTVVETDYESTTALYSGHRTANSAFVTDMTTCDPNATRAALAADHPGFLLIGTLNKPQVIDNVCLFSMATASGVSGAPMMPGGPSAVRLLRTARDQASVFELVGPGSAHPNLSDLVRTAALVSPGSTQIPLGPSGPGDHPGQATALIPSGGQAVASWSWGASPSVRQVSVGSVTALSGRISAVRLEVLQGGSWIPVATSSRAVGDGATPFLLAHLPAGTRSGAMRLVVVASGPVLVKDAHALGVVP